MDYVNKRKNTRSRVWPDTKATIRVADSFTRDSRGRITVEGTVSNLGSNGMFLQTVEDVPVPAQADITIDFDPDSRGAGLSIKASGVTVHANGDGVGIKFTEIDVAKLQKCIIAKMNRLEAGG
jgi:hypothetical protein